MNLVQLQSVGMLDPKDSLKILYVGFGVAVAPNNHEVPPPCNADKRAIQ